MNTVTSKETLNSVTLSDKNCFSAYQEKYGCLIFSCAILIAEEQHENIHKNKIIKIAEQ